MSQSSELSRYKDLATLLFKYRKSGVLRNIDLDEEKLADSAGGADISEGSPEEFTRDLERLGPTFIKLGQALSTRPDLVPEPYINALARMQDDVAPIEFEAVREIFESENNVRLTKVFTEFDEEPLAAASLGQVHRAVMRDGTEVAVKVQRPDITSVIRSDLAAFESLAGAVDNMTEVGRRYDFTSWVREFRKSLVQELDYRMEAENLDHFRDNLADYPDLVVPRPIWDFCSRRVLTMEMIDGQKVTEVSRLRHTEQDFGILADTLMRAYLDQVFVHGLLHADPHPGNVLLTPDNQLALLDLGMVAHVTPKFRDRLLKLLFAAVDGRGEDAAQMCVELGTPLRDFDHKNLVREVSRLVARYQAFSEADSLSEGRLVLELTRVGAAAGVKPPAELSLLGKTLLNLEAVTTALSPSFDAKATVEDHLQSVMRHRLLQSMKPSSLAGDLLEMKEFTREMPKRLSRVLRTLAENDLQIRVAGLDDSLLMQNLQKIANRIAAGLVVAALIVGAAMLMQIETETTLFGYPALAIVLFLLAVILGLFLVGSALLKDRQHARGEDEKP